MPQPIDPAAIAVLTDIAAAVEALNWPADYALGSNLADVVAKFVADRVTHAIAADRLYDRIAELIYRELGSPYTWGQGKTPTQVANALFDAVARIELDMEVKA